MRRFAQPLGLCLLLVAPLPAAELTFDKIFAGAAPPSGLQDAWRPDGRMWTRVAAEGDVPGLRGIDPANGKIVWSLAWSELTPTPDGVPAPASPAASPTLPPPPITPTRYRWSPKSDALVFSAGGDLFLYRLAGKSLRRLTDTPAEEESATYSPDGRRLAYVRDANLYVFDLATGLESQLTSDGVENEVLNGKPDWVYWEEIWNRKPQGFWWSPDSRFVAYYHFDDRAVPTYPLLDERAIPPRVRWQKYPPAGGTNPTVRLRVVELATRALRELATADGPAAGDAYLARVHWRPDNTRIAVERLNRDQTEVDLLLCDPLSGACESIARQSHATWVNLPNEFHFFADGSFLWTSEESGWNVLRRYSATGQVLAQVSPDDWAVTSLDAVLDEPQAAIATGFRPGGLGPADRQVRLLALDGSAAKSRILAGEPGTNAADVAPGGRSWIHRWSDANHPSRAALRRLDGESAVALPGGPALAFDPAKLPQWEFFSIPGPDGAGGGDLPARWLRPAGFDATKRYPVVMYHYGGPGSQVVVNSWEARRGLWNQWMAERGYVVFMVDNQASAYFGKNGEDRVFRNFGPLELAGQLAGVDYLKSLSWVDPARIGLWGWSGGGANTLWSLFHSPGTWRAGVAGAPVADWRTYDTIWTERYMDTPQDNPDGYRSGSALNAATDLKDALLVVHGTGDDNVHPQNTIALLDRLVSAGLPYEDALYPREKHGFQPEASKHFYARMTEFFDRHLSPGADGAGPR